MQFLPMGICPTCKEKGTKVERSTLFYHISDISKIKDNEYFICKNPNCETVYFSTSSLFTCKELNKEIGLKKSSSSDALICYCFNHKKSDVNSTTITDIESKMKNFGCKCEIRNPYAGCCMSGIKKFLKDKS